MPSYASYPLSHINIYYIYPTARPSLTEWRILQYPILLEGTVYQALTAQFCMVPKDSTSNWITVRFQPGQAKRRYASLVYSKYNAIGPNHRVHVAVEMKYCRLSVSDLSAEAYCTAILYVRVTRVKGGGHAPPHPHQPGLIFPSWWNIRQKSAIATLCVQYSVGQTSN